MPALAAVAMLLLGAQRRAPINQYLLPTTAQQQIRCSRQMGQTDRQTDGCSTVSTDTAPHTMQAVTIMKRCC